jgi:hypothetical protein
LVSRRRPEAPIVARAPVPRGTDDYEVRVVRTAPEALMIDPQPQIIPSVLEREHRRRDAHHHHN